MHIFRAKSIIFATGGFGKVFKTTSNAHTLTGDGMGILWRRGLPLEDMEFYQFHPTGLAGLGILLTEGARGEGAILRNDSGERFMERYAPTIKDLAPRDIVARSMVQEVLAGRGAGPNKDYVYLDCTHLGEEVLETKLPDITEFARTYLGVDPVKEPVPVYPTAHYAMGGIPTNNDTQVLKNNTEIMPGLFAAGECACVSVHGANRLGTNSLLDINVFGKRAGRAAVEYAKQAVLPPYSRDAANFIKSHIEGFLTAPHDYNARSVAQIRADLQETMDRNVQVFRTDETLTQAAKKIEELRAEFTKVWVADKAKRYNTELLEAIELGFLLDLAEVVTLCAKNRTESRGGHMRDDFPKRDDENWMHHTMAYLANPTATQAEQKIRLETKPVRQTNYVPQERKY